MKNTAITITRNATDTAFIVTSYDGPTYVVKAIEVIDAAADYIATHVADVAPSCDTYITVPAHTANDSLCNLR